MAESCGGPPYNSGCITVNFLSSAVQTALIGSASVSASDGRFFTVFNPSSDQVIAQVADCGATEAESALHTASVAFDGWSMRTAADRATLLMQWHGLLEMHAEAIAQLITAELGKTLKDSRSEVNYGNAYIKWFAEEARRSYGAIIPSPVKGRELKVVHEPVGVVAVITPWNFPFAMLARKIAPALAAGCTVVARPAEDTPLTGLLMVRLALDAGIPPGVINMVPSSREMVTELTDVWMQSEKVRKISFTGSTPVGKGIAQRAAATLKRLSLELGGNAPFIVFDDADIDLAVKGAVAAKFRNSGQTCVSPNRFFVHAACHEAFVSKLVSAVKLLQIGDPSSGKTDIGPLVNLSGIQKVKRHVSNAVEHGASILVGGLSLPEIGTNYFQPTVLDGVNESMAIFQEETFGPVIGLMKFTDETQMLDIANRSSAGLAAYFYSQNSSRIARVSKALKVGMIGINESLISTEVAPFGGIKDSGYGREGSYLGLQDYLETKYMCVGGLDL